MNLFASYANFKKDCAIHAYMVRLPTMLSANYDRSERYTPEQVIKSIELSTLPQDYKSYAVAMFCDRDAFERYYQTADAPWVYDEIRAKIARLHFRGYISFSVADVYSVSDACNSSSSSGCSSDSGSSDGGGGD
ncbi:DUF6559 family protein [uncultured Psychrobacter sp.]|uniref:DUF6559 family protein n=1 Tax=uncultured Psychrobacter sp. TaxID=259303 RepID=UPI0034589A6A